MKIDDMKSDVSLAYVGSVVPDMPEFENQAFSRAGNMFQLELLRSITTAGLRPAAVFSFLPIPSFPGSRTVWVQGRTVDIRNEMKIHLVSFINITPLKQFSIGVGIFWRLIRWRWTTRAQCHHIVCCYNLTVPPGLMIFLAARLIGARLVALIYDINVPGHTVPAGLFTFLDYWMQRLLIPHLDGFVVVTDEIMRAFAPQRQFIRVEGGISGELLKAEKLVEQHAECSANPIILVMAGGLSETNGILELLRGFALVRGIKVRLRIAGTGPLLGEVKKAVARDSRIEYLGFLSYKEILELYQSADLLINMRLTKRLNTKFFFPSKIMEYLASGIPVITTCPGHLEEEYGRLCYLLKDESAEGLASLIERIGHISQKERFELGRRARNYMLENKTWEAQGRRVVKYIRANVLGLDASE